MTPAGGEEGNCLFLSYCRLGLAAGFLGDPGSRKVAPQNPPLEQKRLVVGVLFCPWVSVCSTACSVRAAPYPRVAPAQLRPSRSTASPRQPPCGVARPSRRGSHRRAGADPNPHGVTPLPGHPPTSAAVGERCPFKRVGRGRVPPCGGAWPAR